MPTEHQSRNDPSQAALIAELLSSSAFTTVLTGAGISTESGIPDFRSPTGKWAIASPILYSNFLADPAARQSYWQQKCHGHEQMTSAAPNIAHRLLAEWEQAGHIEALVTQNIDGLHTKAGSSSVIEIHGNVMQVTCTSECGFRDDSEQYVQKFLTTNQVPTCPNCDGFLKHATISFGQSLRAADIDQAVAWSTGSNLFLALGSSLVVTPAADLPRLAKSQGATIVIINRDPTPLDQLADIVMHAELGATVTQIQECLRLQG